MSTAIGLLGRLAEVEALPEVDAELGIAWNSSTRSMPSATTLQPCSWAHSTSAATSRRRAGECWMPAVSARVDLGDVGAQQLEAGERRRRRRRGRRARPARRACGGRSTSSCSISRSGQRSGLTSSRQIRDGSAPEAADDRPGRAQRGLDVEHGARVEVDEQDLALGQQRQPDLERGGAGAVVEGEQRVVGLGGGEQLARRGPRRRRACRASAPRGRRPRRWRGRRSAGSAASSAPCERNSGNQSVRVRSSSVSAGIGSACSSASAHREQAGALGLRERAEQLLEAVLPAGPGEQRAPRRRCRPRPARSPCARPCRARRDGATAVARRQRRLGAGVTVPGSSGQHRRDCSARLTETRLRRRRRRPRGPSRPAPPNAALGLARAPSRASSSSEMCVSTSRRAPARRPCSPASRGREVAARALALGARQRGLDQQQVGAARELDELVVRARSRRRR